MILWIMLADRWTASTSVPKAELAEALAMMTTKAFSFLLNGPCKSSLSLEECTRDDLVYGVQIAEESATRNNSLHEDTQDIGDNGEEH